MRPQKVQSPELRQRLLEVLQTRGYEGSSLSELAQSAGLRKASLYHRFPGGKKDMVHAVLEYIDQWLEEHVFSVLEDRSRNPRERLIAAMAATRTFYRDGEAICVLRSLSMEGGLKEFGNELRGAVEKWLAGFAAVCIDSGLPPQAANDAALRALITLQGALVVSKAATRPEYFHFALTEIQRICTEGASVQ